MIVWYWAGLNVTFQSLPTGINFKQDGFSYEKQFNTLIRWQKDKILAVFLSTTPVCWQPYSDGLECSIKINSILETIKMNNKNTPMSPNQQIKLTDRLLLSEEKFQYSDFSTFFFSRSCSCKLSLFSNVLNLVYIFLESSRSQVCCASQKHMAQQMESSYFHFLYLAIGFITHEMMSKNFMLMHCTPSLSSSKGGSVHSSCHILWWYCSSWSCCGLFCSIIYSPKKGVSLSAHALEWFCITRGIRGREGSPCLLDFCVSNIQRLKNLCLCPELLKVPHGARSLIIVNVDNLVLDHSNVMKHIQQIPDLS